jgi:hypothetical protein
MGASARLRSAHCSTSARLNGNSTGPQRFGCVVGRIERDHVQAAPLAGPEYLGGRRMAGMHHRATSPEQRLAPRDVRFARLD